jgi:glycine cleavage system protein P-like pyridoxal-binding family
MIEPTESEDKAELDRFCDAMLVSHSYHLAVLNRTTSEHTLRHLCTIDKPSLHARVHTLEALYIIAGAV